MKVVFVQTKLGSISVEDLDEEHDILETLQFMVDGYIETCAPVEIRYHNIQMLANEEGLLKGLEPNPNLFPFFYVGNIVFVGVRGEDFVGLVPSQVEYIKEWIQRLEG